MAEHKQPGKIVSVIYNGIKSTPGDRDNMPTKEHEFIVEATGFMFRVNLIKLLEYASIKKGKSYLISFEDCYMNVPISIMVEGTLYYKETNNRIISIDPEGNKVNHSNNPTFTAMGQSLRAHNLKLKVEGKTPIKPIKRKW